MLAMDARAGQFGQQNVPRHDHLLARCRPSAQPERRAPIAFVHHAVRHQRVVLAMVHHRQGRTSSRIPTRGASGRYSGHSAHRPEIATTPACFNEPIGASSSPAMPLVIAPVTPGNVDHAFPRRFFADQRHCAGIIRIGAGEVFGMQTMEVEPLRRAAAAASRLHMVSLQIARVRANGRAQIDQPRANHQSRRVHPFRASAGAVGRCFPADRRDFPVRKQHVRRCIQVVRWINHAPARQQPRISAFSHAASLATPASRLASGGNEQKSGGAASKSSKPARGPAGQNKGKSRIAKSSDPAQ